MCVFSTQFYHIHFTIALYISKGVFLKPFHHITISPYHHYFTISQQRDAKRSIKEEMNQFFGSCLDTSGSEEDIGKKKGERGGEIGRRLVKGGCLRIRGRGSRQI